MESRVLERTSDGVTSNSNETASQISSTSQAFTTEPWELRSRSPRWPTAIVLACYEALAVFLTWTWWSPLGTRVTAINGSNMTLFSWLLNWTPHALLTGQFPLFSDKLNAPTGITLMWNNGMTLPGLLFAPITVLFGGLFTVTVLTNWGWRARPRPHIGACGRYIGSVLLICLSIDRNRLNPQ